MTIRYHGPFGLDIPRMGYFILYRHDSKGWIGRAIKAAQVKAGFDIHDAAYTHVEVSLGGRHSICIEPPRSKLVDITKRWKGKYIKIVRYEKYPDDKTFRFYHLRHKVSAFAASKCNLPYDFMGIGSFVLKFFKHRKNAYFCSENALWALQMVYPEALNMTPEKCMPAHFCNQEDFPIVWEGKIPQ